MALPAESGYLRSRGARGKRARPVSAPQIGPYRVCGATARHAPSLQTRNLDESHSASPETAVPQHCNGPKSSPSYVSRTPYSTPQRLCAFARIASKTMPTVPAAALTPGGTPQCSTSSSRWARPAPEPRSRPAHKPVPPRCRGWCSLAVGSSQRC